MNDSKSSRISPLNLFLSILIHLLVLVFILLNYKTKTNDDIVPSHFLPAYTTSQYLQQSTPSSSTYRDRKSTATNLQKKPETIALKRVKSANTQKKSILATSLETIHHEMINKAVQQRQSDKSLEPIYLIGDPDHPASGIILVLAKALSAHFSYPRVAGELGIRGRTIIAVTLHPDGHFSDVVMMKSSESRDLDAAALYAVNSAPNAEGADRFLKQPKRFIVGYIFQ